MPSDRDAIIPLEFRLLDGSVVPYRSVRLPGAFQWVTSLFSFHGLAWTDRWKLFSHLEQIWEQAESLPSDLDSRVADEWVASIGQSQEARERIWSPLAQWLTGNALGCLSAATFVQVLSTVFLGQSLDARLTHLHGSIEDRLLGPLTRALEQHGTQVLLQAHTPEIHFGESGVSGVHLHNGTRLHAQWYIAALSYQKLLALLPERLLTRYAYFAQLGELETLPECSVQLTCRLPIRSPQLLLLAGRSFHQFTATSVGTDPITCRLSVTGNHAFTELPDDRLIDLGTREIRTMYPKAGPDEIQPGAVYRETQAALSLKPGAALLRPIQQSPIQNLLIAGAWTDTGWPANVESALVSAKRCTEVILGPPA
jgi:uncharacterized protein with NAD-binding domain and iron-sulfur cluster